MAKSYLDKDGLLYFLQLIRPNATPSMDGTASTGTAKRFALQDHVHPTDTSLAPKASPAFTGTPTAPTAATGTTTTQIATTEFVANTVGAMTSGVSDVKVGGTSVVTNGIANINGNKTAASGGTDLSMVTTGEKYTWNNKASNSVFTPPASSSANGTQGLVPGPTAALYDNMGRYLLAADGSWKYIGVSIANTGQDASKMRIKLQLGDQNYASTIPEAGDGHNGLMPLSDKTKLDSITMSNGIIDASVLPSFVDDVIEAYPRSGATALSASWLSKTSGGSALTPETGKIYVLMADSGDYAANSQFRWGGSAYVKLSDGGVSSITNAEIDTIVAS